jgi:DNA/RNA endonuclease YhcR with UshA esterase domain
MRNPTVCAAIVAVLLGAGTASAHHAFSRDFDQNKPVTLSGTVTKVQWISPHVITYIDVKDNTGKVTNWKVEMGSPAQLTKAGWTRDKLKVGEMVSLQGWQAKNGTHFANAEEVTMPNGEKLSAASSYDQQKGAVATSGSKTPKPQSNEPKPQSTKKSTAPKY